MQSSFCHSAQLAEVYTRSESCILLEYEYNWCYPLGLQCFEDVFRSILLIPAFPYSQDSAPARYGAMCFGAVSGWSSLLQCFATLVQPRWPFLTEWTASACRWMASCMLNIAHIMRLLCSNPSSVARWRLVFVVQVRQSAIFDLSVVYSVRRQRGCQHCHLLLVTLRSMRYCVLPCG